jgi:hypothetical protein
MKSKKQKPTNIKWIVGYIDSYGAIHYKVVKHGDTLDTHLGIWGVRQRKWRWMPDSPNHINTYGDELELDLEDSIWDIIIKLT